MKPSVFSSPSAVDEKGAKLAALDKSQAVIEFYPDGTIITANNNFLGAVGYSLEEIQGQHHSMFVDHEYKDSAEYKMFWESLRQGEYQAAQYKRFGKGGREIWIEASYNPLFDKSGKVFKVIKYATDITAQKMSTADAEGQIMAIHKSQAVIAFNLDGTIITANENFLGAVGYSLNEIQGQHHSLFVEPEYKNSEDYRQFWDKLRRGEYQAAQYKRLGKGGREIWIEASYNPILDINGRPFKVVKFATDITSQIHAMQKLNLLINDINSSINSAAQQSSNATQASEETAQNVQTVASASEELAASTREISESMIKSREATNEVYEQASSAGEATDKLSAAAQAMDGIVGLIQNIASQINLLSLNATIEAARAGEAGRGFAVVANEVKNLAAQAAQATEQISEEISNIQSISKSVVTSLSAINASVEHVREYVAVTAAAVEEQSVVTKDMSANMQHASEGVSVVSESVQDISGSINRIAENMDDARLVASSLAR